MKVIVREDLSGGILVGIPLIPGGEYEVVETETHDGKRVEYKGENFFIPKKYEFYINIFVDDCKTTLWSIPNNCFLSTEEMRGRKIGSILL